MRHIVIYYLDNRQVLKSEVPNKAKKIKTVRSKPYPHVEWVEKYYEK